MRNKLNRHLVGGITIKALEELKKTIVDILDFHLQFNQTKIWREILHDVCEFYDI